MKKFLTLAALLCALLGTATAKAKPELRAEQHKATFTIIMRNEAAKKSAGCSATAIYEHVLLTAEHCNVEGAVLYLNQTTKPFVHPLQVSETFLDHQDHMLIVLPEVSFKHTVAYDPSAYKAFVQGEHYYMWGNPGLVQDQYREGYVTGKMVVGNTGDDDDDSVDATSSFMLLSGPVVGGDSGSGMFTSDGRLAGVLTYGIYYGMFAGTYPLAFTPEQVAQAEGRGTFTYAPDEKRPVISNVTVNVPPAEHQKTDYSLHYLVLFLVVAYKWRDVLRALGGSLIKLGYHTTRMASYTWRLVKAPVRFLKSV